MIHEAATGGLRDIDRIATRALRVAASDKSKLVERHHLVGFIEEATSWNDPETIHVPLRVLDARGRPPYRRRVQRCPERAVGRLRESRWPRDSSIVTAQVTTRQASTTNLSYPSELAHHAPVTLETGA